MQSIRTYTKFVSSWKTPPIPRAEAVLELVRDRMGECRHAAARSSYFFGDQSIRRRQMSDHVYKHIDVTGSSKTSSDDAVRRAITKASESVRGMRWFKVLETRGEIENGGIHF